MELVERPQPELAGRDIRAAEPATDHTEAAPFAVAPEHGLAHRFGEPIEGRQHQRFFLVARGQCARGNLVDRQGIGDPLPRPHPAKARAQPALFGPQVAPRCVRDPVQHQSAEPGPQLDGRLHPELSGGLMGRQHRLLHQVRGALLRLQRGCHRAIGHQQEIVPMGRDRPADLLALIEYIHVRHSLRPLHRVRQSGVRTPSSEMLLIGVPRCR